MMALFRAPHISVYVLPKAEIFKEIRVTIKKAHIQGICL